MTSENEPSQSPQLVLQNAEMENLLASIDVLPSPPISVRALNEVLAGPYPEVEDVVSIIESDPAMTAKLLAVVNSAFFGLNTKITNVRNATSYLGLQSVRNLLTAVELMRAFVPATPELAQTMSALHTHSLVVAQTTRSLMAGTGRMHEGYAAGMMHDIGMLAVVATMPDRYAQLTTALQSTDSNTAELEVFGVSHSHLGAYILDLWGLPESLVESVLHSHDADIALDRSLDTTHCVFVAEQATNIVASSGSPWELGRSPGHDYLNAIGLDDAFTELVATGAPARY